MTPSRGSAIEAAGGLRLERLEELAGDDPEFIAEVLACLLSDLDRGIEAARLAALLGDAPGLAAAAHGLAGACRTAGADALADRCLHLEDRARRPGSRPSPADLDAVDREALALRRAIRHQLGPNPENRPDPDVPANPILPNRVESSVVPSPATSPRSRAADIAPFFQPAHGPPMPYHDKPYVHLTIDAVDTVVLDAEGRIDPELHDHYATFVQARDAALSCVELLLDEGDYDGEDHRAELVRMADLLESAETFGDLDAQADYRSFLVRLEPATSIAA